jgi:predicted RND superfamily exporter protein
MIFFCFYIGNAQYSERRGHIMTGWKQFLQQNFERLADRISRGPKPFMGVVVLTTLMLAIQIFWVTFDTSTEGFLPPDDPAIVSLERARDQYGRAEFVLLTIETQDIFNLQFITKLRDLHQELEANLPYLDSVDSLINARDTRGTEDSLIVADLFSPFPTDDLQLQAIRNRALENPLLRGMLLSADGRYTTVIVRPVTYDSGGLADLSDLDLDSDAGFDINMDPLDDAMAFDPAASVPTADRLPLLSTAQVGEVVAITEAIVARYQSPEFKIYMAGMPVILERLIDTMVWEMLTFMPMAIVVIVMMLGVMFRRRLGVQIPMMVVVFTLLSTIGLFCALRFPVQMPMMIVPTFILTVTVGAAVHFLSIFFQRYDAGEAKADALRATMGLTGIPILLTSLTTAASLLSFVGTPIVPLSRLGLFSAIGVMIAFVYTMIMIPALLTHFEFDRKTATGVRRAWMDRVIAGAMLVATRFSRTVLVVALVLFGVSIWGMQQLNFSHNPLKWLPEGLEARTAVEVIDRNMGGSIPVEIVIDTGVENGLHNPLLLQKIDKLATWLENYDDPNFQVAKVSGLNSVIKETHKALNAGNPDFYTIADSEAVIANELFMFENAGAEQLQPLVDSQFSQMRLAVVMPWIDTIYYRTFMTDIQSKFDTELAGLATTEITGVVPLLGTTLFGVIQTAVQSYAIAFVVITIMMMLLLSSVRMGLLAMIPNLLPILLMLGAMHALNIPLDMFTILVASIAIGIAVDDTVHFMHHFQHYFVEYGDAEKAIAETLHTSGRAMITTSLVLCFGFSQLMWSSMLNITNFGLLIVMTVSMALIADLILAPALMMVVYGKRKNANDTPS